MADWHIYQGKKEPHDGIEKLPSAPKWRQFHGEVIEERTVKIDRRTERRFESFLQGHTFEVGEDEKNMVNTALFLRRPLLVTGKPGTGKSSLAFAVAHELKLGSVLYWPITTRSTLQEGLYRYDAIGRLQEFQLASLQGDSKQMKVPDIGQYIRLGPLGTALIPSDRPRVLLIDEIDKSDIDFPNDLLNIFEEGEFEISELARLSDKFEEVHVFPHDGQDRVMIVKGKVVCREFPFVVMTSNAERELPAPFLRRCLRLDIEPPTEEKLAKIVLAHFGDVDPEIKEERDELIKAFLKKRDDGDLATDQLLNAIYLTTQGVDLPLDTKNPKSLINAILKHLSYD